MVKFLNSRVLHFIEYYLTYFIFLIACLFDIREYDLFLRAMLVSLFIAGTYLVMFYYDGNGLKCVLKTLMSIVLYVATWFILNMNIDIVLNVMSSSKFIDYLFITEFVFLIIALIIAVLEYKFSHKLNKRNKEG